MIIYGHRSREKDFAEGEFTCPHCRATRPYKHKKLIRYLTLFFIPTIPLGSLGETVQCQTCFNSFPPHEIFRPAEGASPIVTTRPPRAQSRRGWGLVIFGALGAGVAALIALVLIVYQFTLPTGPGDNWEGFVGLLVSCPLPLGLVSLGVLSRGAWLIWKVREAWEGR
ncbi:MAG: hypothetical protein Fur0022_07940 [Anaerolineales bacterium]